MTLREAIERADSVKPNAFTPEEKTRWINALEGRIAANVFLMAAPELRRLPLKHPDDQDKELLVTPPHDDLYVLWLEAQIDKANGEYNRYENSGQIYNEVYGDFVRWFARVYEPAQGYNRRFW